MDSIVAKGGQVDNTRRKAREAFVGLYGVTPDMADTGALLAATGSALEAGLRLLQYRSKSASAALRRDQAGALLEQCRRHGALFVINDDWRLARELGAPAVHLGRDDGDPQDVRREVGEAMLIGVSCYASLELARAHAPHVDYLAFGSLFPSSTKPQAPGAALALLGQAKGLGLPVVGIGGIGLANARAAFDAGADAVAVISALFGAASIGEAVRGFQRLNARA